MRQGRHIGRAGLTLLVGLAAVVVTGCPVILGPDVAGTVSFTGTPSKGTAPLTVYFHGKAQVVPPYEVQEWSWTFGDGQTGSGQHIIHTYTQPGLYTVSLTVSLVGAKFRGEEDPPPTELVQTGTIEVLRANAPPIADAGPDQSVFLGPAVVLDGSGSYDPDGDAITYAWTFLSRPAGSTATLTGATTVNPSFWPDRKGPYQLQLIVNDGALDSVPDTVVITVQNRPPIADAGPDQPGVGGLVTTLNGIGSSDPDGDPLTYAWTFVSRPVGSTATLTNATAVNPTFVPDLKGPYQIQLIVNDGTVNSAPDTVVITVPNLPPLANAGPDQSTIPRLVVNLDGSASSDPDSDPLTYAWTFLVRPSGSTAVLNDPTAVMPSFTADRPGVYELQLIVNDGTVDSAPDIVVISTQNRPPVADAGPDQSLFLGPVVALDGSGSSDPDSDPLTYAWSFVSRPVGSAAALTGATTVNPSFLPDLKGPYELQLIVNDGFVDSAPDTVVITVENRPPVADAGPDQSILVGATVTLDGSGSSDPDGDPLTYAWVFLSRPSGSVAALDDATAVGPSFLVDRPGMYELQLIVNDGTVDSAPDTVVITTQNRPPVADAGPDQEVDNDEFVTLDGSGSSDPDGDPLTYAWTMISQPVGSTATLAGAGTVNPTFTTDVKGSYEIQLIVNDGLLDSAPDTVVISTYNEPPTAVAIALPQNDVFADVGADPVLTPDGEVLYGVPRRGEYLPGKQYETPIDLLEIDPATAAILSRIPITMIVDTGLGYLPLADTVEARGLAVDPTNGEMWAILGFSADLPVKQYAQYFALARLDPHTGVAVPCGQPTVNLLSEWFAGLALDDQDLAYGVTGNRLGEKEKVVDTTRALYELDKVDTSDTFVIQFSEIPTGGQSPGEVIAFNTDDGLMYHASGTPQLLEDRIFETLDLDTVLLTGVPLATPGANAWTRPTALTYDPANGVFFLAEMYMQEIPMLYSIAVNGSAAETFIGYLEGYTPIKGLAFLYDKAYPPPLVTLDGSDSWDPEDDPLTFAWSLVSIPAGSAAALSGLTGETTTFTPDLLGAYQIQLVVNDGEYDSGPATVTVNYLNLPPVADAGADQTIPPDLYVEAVQLNGGGSYDPEGGPLTYAWTLLSAPTGSLADDGNISDVTAAAPRFWPDVSSVDEPFVLQLTVTDAEASSATDTVEILYQGIID